MALARHFGSALAVALLAAVVSTSASARTLHVTLNKAEVLRLGGDASSIMVANPAIADVSVQSPRVIVVIGLATGETSLLILDRENRTIADFEVVVVPQSERQVTINRGATEVTLSCDPRCTGVPNPGIDISGEKSKGGGSGSGSGGGGGSGGGLSGEGQVGAILNEAAEQPGGAVGMTGAGGN